MTVEFTPAATTGGKLLKVHVFATDINLDWKHVEADWCK